MKPRRYLTIVQDPGGYPAPGDDLDSAPPDGPAPPVLHSVVLADDHDAVVERLRDSSIPFAPELLPSLQEGIVCAGIQITPAPDGGWQLVIYADADLPFKETPDA